MNPSPRAVAFEQPSTPRACEPSASQAGAFWLLVLSMMAILALGTAGGCAAVSKVTEAVNKLASGETNTPAPRHQSSFDGHPEQFSKYAVLVQDSSHVCRDRSALGEVEDAFNNCLLEKGYRLADRSHVAAIVKETQFQNSGLTGDDAAHFGKMLNVPALVIVDVQQAKTTSTDWGLRFNNQPLRTHSARCAVRARAIDVQTGEILWLASQETTIGISDESEVGRGLRKATEAVADTFPGRHGTALGTSPSAVAVDR